MATQEVMDADRKPDATLYLTKKDLRNMLGGHTVCWYRVNGLLIRVGLAETIQRWEQETP